MDHAEPRLAPLGDIEMSPEQEALLGNTLTGRRENAALVMVRHADRYPSFIGFSEAILMKNALPALEREWVVVRTCHLCAGAYPLRQHTKLAKHFGASEEDVARILAGPDAAGLDDFHSALLRGVDEYVRDHMVSDSTWAVLRCDLSDEQLIDYLLLIGWYATISSTYNSLRVPLNFAPREPIRVANAGKSEESR